MKRYEAVILVVYTLTWLTLAALLMVLCLFTGCELASSNVSRTGSCNVQPSGADDRVALQLALDTCAEVHVDGVYRIATPAWPRARGMLELRGKLVCAAATRLLYSGDAAHQDWYGIWIRGSDSLISGCTIDSTELTNTQEQTHAIGADARYGALVNIEVAYVTFVHPAGDGVDLVGYEPDRTLTNVRVHHSTFERTGRSGVTFFGACHDCEFDRNVSYDVSDQQYDGEGKGGGSHGVKIHHNYGRVGPHSQSGLAVQIQNSSDVDVYSNDFDQGIYVGGCTDCTFHDMTINQAARSDFAVLHIVKSGSSRVWNMNLTRQSEAGLGAVFAATWALSAPTSVEVSDSKFIQYAPTHVTGGLGVESLSFDDVNLEYRSTPGLRAYGISVEGGPLAAGGKRANLYVHNVRVSGPVRAAVRVSGEQAGIGTVSVTRAVSSSNLLCENTFNVIGPLTYKDNTMPPMNCSVP